MKIRNAVIAAVAAAVFCVVANPSAAFADPSLEEVEKELDKKGNEMEKLAEKYNGAKEELKKTEKKIDKIEKRLPKYESKVEDSRKILSDIAAEEYTGGNRLFFAGAALAENPDEALKRISVLGAINSSQSAEIEGIMSEFDELSEDKETLEELKDEQAKTEKDLKKKKKKLDGQIGELEEMREKLGGGSGGNNGSGPPPPSGRAGDVVAYAYDQLGKPYGYGQAGPGSFDCSGLTLAAWKQAGVSLYHKASVQRQETANVSSGDLAPGDLVFYYNDLHHVALYVGDGKVVHAPQSGDVVKVANVNDMPVHSYGRP